jgi:glycosyltransferase involved in cell wall biosynthesis
VVYIESIIEEFAKEGHETFFLSHAEYGETHKNLERFGCKVFSKPVERKGFFQYYFTRVNVLAQFCREFNIDIVYSHFQEANIIAVLSQYFTRAKIVITRHHSDCAFLDKNWKERWADRIINLTARHYITTSPKVFDQTVMIEGRHADKVMLVNYGYNFSRFNAVNHENVASIRKEFPTSLLLVQAARFIEEKRPKQLIDAVSTIVEKGQDVKLLMLGRGPMESEIKNHIRERRMEEYIHVVGFKLNVMDYYAAADLVVHFSLTEASNSAMKEAAITDTPVAVCEDVGDFSEYIQSEKNGFLLSKQDPGRDLIELITRIGNQEFDLPEMGRRLHKDVLERFSISNVIHFYNRLNASLLK